MSDHENKLHAQRTKGAAADAELRTTAEAFVSLRTQYSDAWVNSDPRDTAGREKMWLAMTILAQVEKNLRTCVSNGVLAAKEIDKLRQAGEPKPEKPIALREFRRA